MVFYRKYRPQKIKELDSSEIREKLYSVLKSSSVAHAFLFTGPKGLGKTSTARIVAKALNCLTKRDLASPDPKDIEPCNKCDQCVSITNGINLDVLEIDGASNRGIDEIRDLREKVKLSPASAKKKVYIIDEVHMLTTEAFNALLKTLEEPPSHVVFILCTTEPHKVPLTIVSRCLHIQFNKASPAELISSFGKIIKSEKIQADKEALSLIAGLSDGSFRDGVKILEEMAGFNKKITKKLVEEKYQISNMEMNAEKMIHFLGKRDAKKAVLLVSELVEYGVDIKYFIEQLVEDLHGSFLAEIGVDKNERAPLANLTLDEIRSLIELLSKAHSEVRYAVLPRIPLELAIVEWKLRAALRSPRQFDGSSSTVQSQSPNLAQAKFSKTDSQDESFKTSSQVEALLTTRTNNFWQDLINKVKKYNHSVAGVLRGCSVKSYDGKTLLIETNFKFHKDKLSEIKVLGILEKACQEITKKNIKVSVIMKMPA